MKGQTAISSDELFGTNTANGIKINNHRKSEVIRFNFKGLCFKIYFKRS